MLAFLETLLGQIQPKEWFLFFAGIAIPLSVQLFFHLYSVYRTWEKTSTILGTWHSYNWSRRHQQTIWAHEIWKISRSWRSGLRIDMVVDGQEAVGHYRGQVTFESGHILFSVEALAHPEHYEIRFADCVIASDTILHGVFLAPDYDRHIFGAAIIATQTVLSEDEAKPLLAKSAEVFPGEFCVRVKE